MKMEIKTIGVIGAGQMGAGIAQVAALAGYDVILNDIKQEFVDRGMGGIQKAYPSSLRKEGWKQMQRTLHWPG